MIDVSIHFTYEKIHQGILDIGDGATSEARASPLFISLNQACTWRMPGFLKLILCGSLVCVCVCVSAPEATNNEWCDVA